MQTERNKPTTKNSGIYLVGSTYFNPHSREELYFLKVGMASNLKQRVASYKTDNPGIWQIDFREVSAENTGDEEIYCHQLLELFEIDINSDCDHENTEWTQVSREDYLYICEVGFDFFY